ncbi:MAG TPA: DUF433 domain-containing protein [Acidimicrobiales bacterium]|nr:DUF433 domain-containing protein [Acidimicrobiales bacterium]
MAGHGASERLTEVERSLIRRALRTPRGRYTAERASQLAGVPVRTLHEWATTGTLRPDGHGARPRTWSYRDVVYARMLAWLRGKGMPRRQAAAQVARVRHLMARPDRVDAGDGDRPGEGDGGRSGGAADGNGDLRAAVRSDGHVLLTGDDAIDPLSGQQVFAELTPFLDAFDPTAPVAELADGPVWGPNLVRPSAHTTMSPWVAGGEPCVAGTRVPTAVLHALHVERRLDAGAIAALYPGVDADEVRDAVALERRLRHQPDESRAAAA